MGVRVWLFPKDSDRFVWGGTCHPYSHKKHSKFQQRTAYPRLLQANLEGQTHLYINLIDTLKPTEESSLVHPVPIVHPAPCETKLKSHEKKKKGCFKVTSPNFFDPDASCMVYLPTSYHRKVTIQVLVISVSGPSNYHVSAIFFRGPRTSTSSESLGWSTLGVQPTKKVVVNEKTLRIFYPKFGNLELRNRSWCLHCSMYMHTYI